MARILDPDRFMLSVAVVDWSIAAKRHGKSVTDIVEKRKVGPVVVQLRWILDPKLGLPTQAFQVWRRDHDAAGTTATPPVNLQSYPALGGVRVYGWDEPLVFIRGTATANAGATGQLVGAFAGAPFNSTLVGAVALGTGAQPFSFSGLKISSLVVFNGTASGLVGFGVNNAADDPAWKPIERVGLPVDQTDWSAVFGWPKDQGLEGALVPPLDAALDRYRRGAPFFGWDDLIEAGRPAPLWIDTDPKAIIDTMRKNSLDDLRTMILSRPPHQHVGFTVDHALQLQGGSHTAATSFRPIQALMLGISADPQLSLIAGFGTAYDFVGMPDTPGRPVPSAAIPPKASPFDFMVTVFYEKGLDGNGAPEEYAAIVCAPRPPFPVLAPANLAAQLDGLATPAVRDTRYRALVRAAWDLLPQTTPFRVASYAAARYGLSPPSGSVPLMDPRQDDPNKALQPISATTSQQIADTTGQLQTVDETYLVDPAIASNQLRHGIAHQDLFGQWSTWSAAGLSVGEPPVQRVGLVAASLQATAPASGSICDASLVLDFSWDWTVRSPKQVNLVGRLYATTKRGLPPTDLSLPSLLATNFPAGTGGAFAIAFNGADAGSVPANATLAYITADAKALQPTPVIVAGPRRYRLTINGLKLDFASTGHIGMALWAQGRENMLPQRAGAFSTAPLVTSASDPRPPVIVAEHENVQLASLADAKGEYRARVAWDAMPGAAGYYVYESTESKFRIAAGLGEALASQTLLERLLDLRNAFQASPRREPFTRLNSTPIINTSTEVVIQRGSKEIHMYLVLGSSAGQVESAWPSLSDSKRGKRFFAFAAPQVVPPSAPKLELSRVKIVNGGGQTSYRAKITLRSRPGAPVTRVDLHRTRVATAAAELDTMGPPLARISGPDPIWQVQPTTGTGPEAQALGTITGQDDPGGSWSRVYYQAVAVAADDLSRGHYGGRSALSGSQWIVVPPATPPALSPVSADWPGGALEAARFTFTSVAPIADTDLGPHRLRVEVFTVGGDGLLSPLFSYPPASSGTVGDSRLSVVPTTPAAAPALWREDAGGGASRYRVLVNRTILDDTLRFHVMLIDPLGRASEMSIDSPGGSPLPAPDITGIRVTAAGTNRFILSFRTQALFTNTPLGPYTLTVVARPPPGPVFPPPRPVTVRADLPTIAPLLVSQDPFAGPEPIPLRQRGGTISVFLRARANVALTLMSPDGRTAQANRAVP
jgi:hypothetical protein